MSDKELLESIEAEKNYMLYIGDNKRAEWLDQIARRIQSFDKRAIINEFIDKVDALAQEKMLITGVREGAHYAAMKQLQQEMNDE